MKEVLFGGEGQVVQRSEQMRVQLMEQRQMGRGRDAGERGGGGKKVEEDRGKRQVEEARIRQGLGQKTTEQPEVQQKRGRWG